MNSRADGTPPIAGWRSSSLARLRLARHLLPSRLPSPRSSCNELISEGVAAARDNQLARRRACPDVGVSPARVPRPLASSPAFGCFRSAGATWTSWRRPRSPRIHAIPTRGSCSARRGSFRTIRSERWMRGTARWSPGSTSCRLTGFTRTRHRVVERLLDVHTGEHVDCGGLRARAASAARASVCGVLAASVHACALGPRRAARRCRRTVTRSNLSCFIGRPWRSQPRLHGKCAWPLDRSQAAESRSRSAGGSGSIGDASPRAFARRRRGVVSGARRAFRSASHLPPPRFQTPSAPGCSCRNRIGQVDTCGGRSAADSTSGATAGRSVPLLEARRWRRGVTESACRAGRQRGSGVMDSPEARLPCACDRPSSRAAPYGSRPVPSTSSARVPRWISGRRGTQVRRGRHCSELIRYCRMAECVSHGWDAWLRACRSRARGGGASRGRSARRRPDFSMRRVRRAVLTPGTYKIWMPESARGSRHPASQEPCVSI